MANHIHHKLFFSHPPAIVWEYLTNQELISQWLMENDFQPIVGYDFRFRARPIPDFNFDGIIYCKVVEIVPFKKLSYSWKGGPGNGVITFDSLVVWTLHEKEGGTEVELEHTGFEKTDLTIYSIMDQGWLKNMKKIGDLINTSKYGTTNA